MTGQAADPANVFNFHWTMADMDKLVELTSRRLTAKEIADRFACDAAEIRVVCERNGLTVWKSSQRAAR